MMVQTPQIEPITNMQRHYKGILAKLGRGPVFLALRSKPAAVLVSVEQWDQMVRRVAEADGRSEARRIVERIERGEEKTVTLDELKRQIVEARTDATVGDRV